MLMQHDVYNHKQFLILRKMFYMYKCIYMFTKYRFFVSTINQNLLHNMHLCKFNNTAITICNRYYFINIFVFNLVKITTILRRLNTIDYNNNSNN